MDLLEQLSHSLDSLLTSVKRSSGARPAGSSERLKRVRWLTSSQVQTLRSEYVGGASVRDLAHRYGVHRTTISGHLKQNGIQTRAAVRKLTDQKVVEAAKFYSSGMSLARIGELYDVDGSTVRKELAKIGVVIRKRY